MQNTEGKTMVIGPQFRLRDRSYVQFTARHTWPAQL